MRILELEEDNYGAILKLELNRDEIEILCVGTGYFNIEDAVIQVLEEAIQRELEGY